MLRIFNNPQSILKIYTTSALVISAILSPLALSFVPILVLIWFLYQWRWPLSQLIDFLTQYFTFFAVGLLFTSIIGPYFAVLISLPLVASIDLKLRDIGHITHPDNSSRRRSLTNICVVSLSVTFGVLVVGLLVGNIVLLLSCGAMIIYFLVLGVFIWRWLPSQPVVGEPMVLRGVAGRELWAVFTLKRKSRLKGMLFLESDYRWFKLVPNAFVTLEGSETRIEAWLTPPLSGPSDIKINAYVIDPWGLSQVKFEINAMKLIVIPRAKYADWLAKKYLSGSKPGQLPLVSNVGSIKPLYGLQRGVEFYGIKMYQPGDSLKNIDWKHSVKYNELVSKEFIEVQAPPAIILINLVANDIETADKLAYNIVISGLCLAQNGIPAALAVYNDENVILTTQSLASRELVIQTLGIVKEIVTRQNSMKYLNPPNVNRLRANMSRLSHAESQPAQVLRELLQIEFKTLSHNASSSPCTEALNKVIAKTNKQATIIIISGRNHDAEALAFNEHILTGKGSAVVFV